MVDFKQLIAEAIADAADLKAEDILNSLETPPQPEMGDYAFPCFKLAKTFRKAPPLIAADLAGKFTELPEFLAGVKQEGAYLNFFLNPGYYISAALKEILDPAKQPGRLDIGGGRTVIVEYSSPNIAKPFHVGHAFTTILGESLARIYQSLGYDTLRFNHLGDYGTQFGKLMVAYDRWVDEEALEQAPIKELTRIYVKFHQEAEQDTSLEDEARERFLLLEEGSPREKHLWERFRELSLLEFDRIYERLGICFDNLNGESFYSDQIPAVVDQLREKNLLEESRGAQVVMLEDEDLPPCIILKSDGATIYASRDIAALIWRWNHHHFDKNIYVVGMPQALHFRQVFSVAKKMGYDAADSCEHVAFGTVRFADGKFSTREGNAILLDDLLAETVQKTGEIIRRNNEERGSVMSEAEIREAAEKIGLAAVQYTFLRNGRERDIIFSWDEMLDFNGDTAPYLIYTYARARSILRRAAPEDINLGPDGSDFSRLSDDHEFQLARLLLDFTETVQQAARANEPFMVARHIGSIARLFNKYYSQVTILGTADTELRRSRLALLEAVCRVLEAGFDLLGIQPVERM